MQAGTTASSLGRQLTYLMGNCHGPIVWFLMHKSLNFRALSTPSRAGGFFFFNPSNRLAFLPNSHTSMVSNTWKSGEQQRYHSICKGKQLHLLSEVTGICLRSSGGIDCWPGWPIPQYQCWILFLPLSAHSLDTKESFADYRSSVRDSDRRGRTKLHSKFPITKRLTWQRWTLTIAMSAVYTQFDVL